MLRVVLIWSWNAGEGVLRGRTRRLNVGSWASWSWVGDAAAILSDLIWERVVGEGFRTGDGAEPRTGSIGGRVGSFRARQHGPLSRNPILP